MGSIRERFERYAKLVQDTDRQSDRLAEMEESALSPSTSTWSAVPSGGGMPGDRVSRAVEIMEAQRVRVAEAISAERAERHALSLCLVHLDPDERAVVERFYFDLQTCDVIAERMGMSDRGVRNVRDRAFRKMEAEYEIQIE